MIASCNGNAMLDGSVSHSPKALLHEHVTDLHALTTLRLRWRWISSPAAAISGDYWTRRLSPCIGPI